MVKAWNSCYASWTRAAVTLLQSFYFSRFLPNRPCPLSSFDTHGRWQPVTQSARSRRSYGKIEDGAQSNDRWITSNVPYKWHRTARTTSDLVFLLYINDLGENCTSRMRLFADDALIYCTIESYNDAVKLHSDLTVLEEWAQKLQMKFNPSKCHVLRISRKQNPVESDYTVRPYGKSFRFGHPPPLSRRRNVQKPRLGPACI